MASPLQPRRPKVGGVYPGSMVARGGQQGRLQTMHMGLAGTMNGGRNASATPPRTMGYPRPAGRVVMGGQRGNDTVNPLGNMSTADLHHLGGAHTTGTTGVRHGNDTVNPMHPVSTAPPPAPPPPPAWASNPDYMNQLADLDFQHKQQLAAYQQQLSGLSSQFALGQHDINQWNVDDRAATNANLNARGLYFSGGTTTADASRAESLAKQNKSNDDAYGKAATNRINQGVLTENQKYQLGLDALNRTFAAQKAAADAAAAEANAQYAPAPTPGLGVPGAAAPSPAGAPAAHQVAPGPVVYHRDHNGQINLRDSTGRWFYNVHPPAHGATYI